jgi:crotonobetainyl-CoA:carnitine CoA-transferase CaiB-like acyl-CoA transferase
MNAENKTQTQSREPILKGLKVIELGHFISAPITGMLLAEQGAEVIHIVNPNEPTFDPILDAILERGKKRLTLDLKNPKNLFQFIELLSVADIVVENYELGTMQKLGIDFDKIRKEKNPRLISCSIPGYPKGDKREFIKPYEGIIGFAGYIYEKPLSKPIYFDFPIASVLGGLYAATAILAGLIARNRDGVGQHIDVTLYSSALTAQILQVITFTGVPRKFLPLKMLGTPFMRSWEALDHRYIYVHIVSPVHNAQFLEKLESIGLKEDADKLLSVLSSETRRDPSLVKNISEAKKITKVMQEIMIKKTADEWEALFGEELCFAKIRNLSEWITDNEKSGLNDTMRISDPVFGELTIPGASITLKDFNPIIQPRELDKETLGLILTRWKSSYQSISPTQKENLSKKLLPPLAGIRIADLSRIIAGPYAVRVLTELGADVYSIQGLKGLDWAITFHVAFNVGKKCINLDFTTDEGKETLWKLIDYIKPNVVLQNFRNLDITEKIGIDYQSFLDKYPNIVYSYLNAYGVHGDWQERPAFEQLIQSITGLQDSYVKGKKPRIFPIPILDMGSGLLGSYGTLLGLYYQQQTGKSLFFNTHMTTTATLLQIIGFSALQQQKMQQISKNNPILANYNPEAEIITKIVKMKDGYACLAGPKQSLLNWFVKSDIISQSDLQNAKFENIFKIVEPVLSKKKLEFWGVSLHLLGFGTEIGLIRRYKITKAYKDIKNDIPQPEKIMIKKDYQEVGLLTHVYSPMTFIGTPLLDIAAAPVRGANTYEYLTKIGMQVPEGAGHIPYPEDKPLLSYVYNLIAWGIFALRSGNM